MSWYRHRLYYRQLNEGDVLMRSYDGPVVLVKLTKHKAYRETYAKKMTYWKEGTFMILATGVTYTRKLGNGKVECHVERARVIVQADDEDDEVV